jgi:hypothetical protein
MIEWVHFIHLLPYLFAASVLTFIGSLIAIPLILVRLPAHYFDERHPRTWLKDHHPFLRLLALGLKNLFGVLFILAGIAMLVLPGQGVLTMLIGLSLIDFPGKLVLERKLVSTPMVLKTINLLRERFGRAPLIVYPHCHIAPQIVETVPDPLAKGGKAEAD